jgi:hypothetical protein
MLNCEKYLSHCDIATVIKKNYSENNNDCYSKGASRGAAFAARQIRVHMVRHLFPDLF